MITSDAISTFVKERNEALFSLDETKIKAYAKKYGIPLPSEPLAFWGGVYKAICTIASAPDELKTTARKWLSERGMSEVT